MRKLGAVVGVLLGLVGYVLWNTGLTTQITHRYDGSCRADHSVPSVEDIIIDPALGVAYLSSFNATTASVYAVDLREQDQSPRKLALQQPKDWLPLGIAGFPAAGPFTHLFVINRTQQPSIEVFGLPGGEHIRSIQHPLIRYPNNLVAVGTDELYVTNTHASVPGTPKRWLDTLLRLETGSVIRLSGDDARIAAEDIGYANGIAASRDGQRLYVGSIATHEMHRFERAPGGELTRLDRIPALGGVDNLSVAEDGSIYAAVHPKAFDALAHLSGNSPIAPSRIVQIKDDIAQVVYEDPGQEIAAAATGAVWGPWLLIGPVRDDHFLVCRNDRAR